VDFARHYYSFQLLESLQLAVCRRLLTRNCRVQFVSESGAHTNNIESRWNAVKKLLLKYGTNKELYNSYFMEYCIHRIFLDNSADKLLEFFMLIFHVNYNQCAQAEPASQATPTFAVSATRADGLLSQATPPSAASAIVVDTTSWYNVAS